MSKKKSSKTQEIDEVETEEIAEAVDDPAAEITDEDETTASMETDAEPIDTKEDTVIDEETEEEVPLTQEDELELARQEAAKNLDSWQRAVAEMANYKRRQEEQRKLQRDRIKGEVLQGVVSALDDMDLAFQNLPEELDGQLVGWVEGFRLVQRKLDRMLEDQNVMPISIDDKFDPNFHEAVSYEESEEHEEGDIIAELRKGYQIGSRVIRPALVRVAS